MAQRGTVDRKARGADKTKPPASQTPVIAHEIVPGKFNDNDWNLMLERDGAEDFVLDIMDELMEKTMSTIYEKYIERQLLPFTITQARDAIIEIIEWQFLARDEGENNNTDYDWGWIQDEEPEPAETDCWAQGSVPKNVISVPMQTMEEIPEEAPMEEEKQMEPQAELELQEPPELEDVVSEPDENTTCVAQVKQEKELKNPSAAQVLSKKKRKNKFKPYRGKLKSAGVSKMTESLEDREIQMMYDEFVSSMPPNEERPSTLLNMPASCTSILKCQTGRPPGNKDVAYDELGNVIAVMKLDPEKLPSHKVNVKYHVVDPAVEAAQARLDAMRKGKSTGKPTRKLRSSRNLNSDSSGSAGSSKTKVQTSLSSVAPLPPPLIEEMEVSHGVIIREGGRVKKGPGRYYRKLDILEENQKGMKPVSVRLTNSGITVNDLLDRNTPILRPLGDSSPLPPILPQPPAQPKSAQVS